MTQAIETAYARYGGNGMSTTFVVPFSLFDLDDLQVQLFDNADLEVPITKGGFGTYDYVVGGAFDVPSDRYNSPSVIFNTALPNGYRLGMRRGAPIEQTLNMTAGGALPAESLERRLDRVVSIAQDLTARIAAAPLEPIAVSDYYDVQGKILRNVADPVQDGDGVNLGTLRAAGLAPEGGGLPPAVPTGSVQYNQSNTWNLSKTNVPTPASIVCAGTAIFAVGTLLIASKRISATLDPATGNISLVESAASGEVTSVSFTGSNTRSASATVTCRGVSLTLTWTSVKDGQDGAVGSPGAPGAPGTNGTSVTIKGTLANTGLLPPSGNTVGDGYLISGHLWVWDGAAWVDVGVIQGPAGSNGTNGTNGTNGIDGTNGLSIVFLAIYQRATSVPATPTGGSFNFGTSQLTPPAGWTSFIPSGTDPVYSSFGQASIQGSTGIDSTITWTTPILAVRNGIDGADGALAWAAADVQMGALSDIVLTKNAVSGGGASFGGIRLQGSTVFFRSGNAITGAAFDLGVATPYTGTTRTASVFYLFINRTVLASTRFGGGFNANVAFVAEYDATAQHWNAIGSGNQVVPFSPTTDDAIIGIGSRPSTADQGIRTLASFIVNMKFDVNTAPVFFSVASIQSALIQSLIADKIAAGSITVAMQLTTGNIQVSQSGFIGAGKQTFGSIVPGFFIGMNAGVPTFNIGDGTNYVKWDGATLSVGGNIIATGNINSNAVTAPAIGRNPNVGAFMALNVWNEVVSAAIGASGGFIKIAWGVEIENTGGQAHLLAFRLRRSDGTILWQTQSTQGVRVSGGESMVFSMPHADAPPAGAWTYALDVQQKTNSGSNAVRQREATIDLVELKR